HLMLIDLSNKDITGKVAENTLGKADITINKNMVPFDKESPFITSGMRIGSAAITTRGMKEKEMKKVVFYIDEVLKNRNNEKRIREIKKEINKWMVDYPLFK
ncbi:MAG: serine hydroxymethyltransferase, partial [Flammeovirgaceae bacterium]|nr:serine hydroxymethyltransferase [Flammeovirgaceae bacterium]